MIHTPCASTSSMISCNTWSAPAISNDGGPCGAGVNEFRAFRVTADNCAGEQAACEGIEIASKWSSTTQILSLAGRLVWTACSKGC